MAALEPARVAEILVDLPEGGGRRGTGYRVRHRAVLTAAHVIAGPGRIRVRFNADRPGEQTMDGAVAWASDEIDVAVITIPESAALGSQDEPPAYAAVPDSAVVLDCVSVGFPRFKMRADRDGKTRYRDMFQAVGTCAALSNRRSGTLEISVPPPEHDPDPDASPWEGMSGAAVWSDGHIIGILAEHHRAEGLARLAASRVGRWQEVLGEQRLHSLAALIGLTAIGEPAPPRPDLTYRAQVRDIAPVALEARSAELADVARFCAREEPYLWWQGPPWAGKTALAAWIVLNPPPGVVVVSFFITARLAGQADSGAFTAALVSQLAALVGVQPAASASPADRDAERRWLLDQAVSRVTAAGKRLLLVVDGLDEDQGGQPSIAALLPPRPPPGLRVLVTSRPFPGIPDDVPGDHPLRRCQPGLLSAYAGAQGIEAEARRDLSQLGGQDAEVVGVLAASGGGLAYAELAALTGQPEFELRSRLGTSVGRVLTTRVAADRDQVIMFAHETLRATAEAIFGSDVARYRERIHQWADEHAADGWPGSTPRYLLQPYGRLLAGLGDVRRLTTLAADPARQNQMLRATYSDTASLAELDAALTLVTGTTSEDLKVLATLAIGRDRVRRRGAAIPVVLPGAWARLGNTGRAEALARGLHGEGDRAWALADIACLLATDAPAEARQAAGQAEAILQGHKPWHISLYVAMAAQEPSYLRDPVVRTAEALARTGQRDSARRLATQIEDPWARSMAWSAIVASGAGDTDAVELAYRAAMAAPEVFEKVRALTELARALRATDRARAHEVATQALTAAISSPCPMLALSRLDQYAREALGRRLHDLHDLMEVVRDAAGRMSAQEDDDEMISLLTEANARCGTFFDTALTSHALARGQTRDLALRCVEGFIINRAFDDLGNMERMVRPQEVIMLSTIAPAVAGSFIQQGLTSAARELLAAPWSGGRMWAEVMTDCGPPDEAELAATASWRRAELLARLAVRLAAADPVAATRVAATSEDLARNARLPDRAIEMVSATYSLLGHGKQAAAAMSMMSAVTTRLTAWNAAVLRRTDPAQATRIREPRHESGPGEKGMTWHAWAVLGESAHAIAALEHDHPLDRGILARIMADAGHPDDAERIADELEDWDVCYTWAALARARARDGQVSEATRLLKRSLAEVSSRKYRYGQAMGLAMVVAACADVDLPRAAATARAPGVLSRDSDAGASTRVQCLSAFAVALQRADPGLAANLLSEAETIAEQIPDHREYHGRDPVFGRDHAMNVVAVAAACAGMWDRAERLCLAVPDETHTPVPAIMAGVPDPAAYLMAPTHEVSNFEPWLPPEFSLAGAAVGRRSDRRTDIPRARRLIGRILRAGDWAWALGPLAGTDPDIALRLCDVAYAQLSEQPTS